MNAVRVGVWSSKLLCTGTVGLIATVGSLGWTSPGAASESLAHGDESLYVERDGDGGEGAIAPSSQFLEPPSISTSVQPTDSRLASYSTQASDLQTPEPDPIEFIPFSEDTEMAQGIDRMSDFGREQMEEVEVPEATGQTISAIEVQFIEDEEPVEDGVTRDFIITREFEIEPGDVYDPEKVQDGLQRLMNLSLIQDASVSLQPTDNADEVVMVVTVDERRSHFGIGFGLTLPHPTALEGVARPATVLPGTNRKGGVAGGFQFQWRNLGGNNQTLSLGVEGGETAASYDIGFVDPWIAGLNRRIGYSVNFFNVREVNAIFDGGDEVELSNDNDPWVHRLGGGVEFFTPLTDSFAIASGLSYQRVSVRDEVFTGAIFPEDEQGNDLTFSGEGRDDLLSTSFSGALDRRDDRLYPTRGYRLLFRNDLFIPIGNANIAGDRISGNFTQFLPLPFFGNDEPSVFVFNVQGGTFIGDLPPYEAFSLGGSGSVRGYEAGEVGSGRSFVQATVEYRFPLFDFSLFREDIGLGGTLFVDYANDLGSGDTVVGEPAEVRNKPGDGAGFGGGIRARTPFGPMRLEVGVSDEGDTEVMFQIGDRF